MDWLGWIGEHWATLVMAMGTVMMGFAAGRSRKGCCCCFWRR